jgi:predicted phage tail protein
MDLSFVYDQGMQASGQTGPTTAQQNAIADTVARSAIEALGPILQRDIIPQILRDRNALTILGSEAGKAATREAGAWGAVFAAGIGLLGVGVCLAGTASLVRAIKSDR